MPPEKILPKLELGGPQQGRFSIRLQTPGSAPREYLLTAGMFEGLLVLVCGFLQGESSTDLLPTIGSKAAVFKNVERLRIALGHDRTLIVWDAQTLYHAELSSVTCSRAFSVCKRFFNFALIDDIVQAIDHRPGDSAA